MHPQVIQELRVYVRVLWWKENDVKEARERGREGERGKGKSLSKAINGWEGLIGTDM